MIAAAVLAGYLLGSLPFAYVIAKRFGGVDVRREGSRNVGATNVLRTTGPWLALPVALLDIAKGAAAVWLVTVMNADVAAPASAAAAAVVGHVYPVWLRFHGGKGIAVAAGAFGLLAPAAFAVAALIFLAVVWSTRYVSLGSIAATVSLPLLIAWMTGSTPTFYSAVLVAALILLRHRGNLLRLLSRTERRLGERA